MPRLGARLLAVEQLLLAPLAFGLSHLFLELEQLGTALLVDLVLALLELSQLLSHALLLGGSRDGALALLRHELAALGDCRDTAHHLLLLVAALALGLGLATNTLAGLVLNAPTLGLERLAATALGLLEDALLGGELLTLALGLGLGAHALERQQCLELVLLERATGGLGAREREAIVDEQLENDGLLAQEILQFEHRVDLRRPKENGRKDGRQHQRAELVVLLAASELLEELEQDHEHDHMLARHVAQDLGQPHQALLLRDVRLRDCKEVRAQLLGHQRICKKARYEDENHPEWERVLNSTQLNSTYRAIRVDTPAAHLRYYVHCRACGRSESCQCQAPASIAKPEIHHHHNIVDVRSATMATQCRCVRNARKVGGSYLVGFALCEEQVGHLDERHQGLNAVVDRYRETFLERAVLLIDL